MQIVFVDYRELREFTFFATEHEYTFTFLRFEDFPPEALYLLKEVYLRKKRREIKKEKLFGNFGNSFSTRFYHRKKVNKYTQLIPFVKKKR